MGEKLKIQIIGILVLLMLGLGGCQSSKDVELGSGAGGLNQAGPQASDATATEAVGCLLPDTPPPYLGMWMFDSEDGPQMVVFTETSYYLVEAGKMVGPNGGTRERFAEITGIDLEKSQVTLKTKWIRINGEMVGYDSPTFFLSYRVENEMLSFGTGTETFPTELDYGPFSKH